MAAAQKTTTPRIGVILGSNRTGSINRALAHALEHLVGRAGKFSWIKIENLPLYNPDMDGRRPQDVETFIAQAQETDGYLFVTPEHNRSIPALLKNAVDWGSRPKDQSLWRDKVVAVTGASPGAIGAAIGHQHLRQILGALGAVVVGGEAYVHFRPGLIDDDGKICDHELRAFLGSYLSRFLHLIELTTKK